MFWAILMIVAGLLLSQINAIGQRHRDNERRDDIAALQIGVAGFYAVHGYYPANLGEVKSLSADNCRGPRSHGNCQSPDYSYKAFRAGTSVNPVTAANCTNKKPATICAGYVIYTNSMERGNNPYSVSSY